MVSLIVSTLGVKDDIPRLVRSLQEGDYPGPIEVVVVDQSRDQHVNALAQTLESNRITIVTSTSGLGVSTGRNEGLRKASGAILGFPDDDTWLEHDCLTRVVAHLREDSWQGVSGRQACADGSDSMLRWLKQKTPVTRTNWPRTTIASTMFLTREVVDEVGFFEESIGSGSKGWVGAGEETDLMLRVLAAGFRVVYDPRVVVFQPDPRSRLSVDFVGKMLRYGAGMGHLFRVHRLPAWLLAWIASRKLVSAGLAHVCGDEIRRDSQLAFVRGIVAGVTRRPPQPTRPRR